MSDFKASLGECTEKFPLSTMIWEGQFCSRSGYRLSKAGTEHDNIKVIVHYSSDEID